MLPVFKTEIQFIIIDTEENYLTIISDMLFFWKNMKLESVATVTLTFESASHNYELKRLLLLLKRQKNKKQRKRHRYPIISTCHKNKIIAL